jgi:uncharacterized RDD family membrane protein YckC
VLATLLDTLILASFAVAAGVVSSVAGASEEVVGWVIVGAALLASAVYGPMLLVRAGEHNGQTIGKQVLKVRSVRADGHAMDLRTAAVREFVGKTLLGLLPFYTIVDSCFPLADARRQAIHDKLARTFVVTADAVPDFDSLTPDGGAPDAFGRPAAPPQDRAAELPGGFSPPEPGRRD